MSRIVQEKFQVEPDYEPEGIEGGNWASDAGARDAHDTRGRKLLLYPKRGPPIETQAFQSLPPGTDPGDQSNSRAGDRVATRDVFDWSQPERNPTRAQVREGFVRLPMSATDDLSTSEPFYDSVEVDGVEGFVERNNMLDRS